jgi:hypothetical protein
VKRVRLVVLVLLALGLAWSGAWVYGRHRVIAGIDPALADLAAKGIVIDCPDRVVGGYPVRLDVTCPSATVTLPDGSRATTTNLELGVAATAWTSVGAHLAAPSEMTLATGEVLRVEEGSLDLSLRLSGGKPAGLDLTTSGLRLTLLGDNGVPAALSFGAGKLSLRTDGDAIVLDGDIAGLDVSTGTKPLTPAPAALTAHLRLEGGATLLEGVRPDDWLRSGGRLVVAAADLSFGKARLRASGEASVGEDGRVNAGIDTVAHEFAELPAAAKAARRKLAPAFAGLAMAYMIMGKSAPEGGKSIRVDIVDGVVSAGGRRLAELPPLR